MLALRYRYQGVVESRDIYDATRSKMSGSAQPDESDPEYKNGPNGFELDAVLFWASGTQ